VAAASVCSIAFTILVGVLLLGDLTPGSAPRARVTLHVALALAAAVVVCVAALGGASSAAWVGSIGAGVTAGAGIWLYRRVRSTPARMSPGLLIAHGVGAAATVGLALLAAVRG
jgi:hypothetical protein